ncbi:MAG: SRPBCC family protein [Rhodococcus sp. (in: high G+C Gram-positive bacteria)]
MATTVKQSHTLPLAVEDAFPRTLASDLPSLFRRGHGPIPAIRGVRGQTGSWDRAGQTRTIVLANGATMHEELIEVVHPTHFTYRITEMTGAFSLLVEHAEGRWQFGPHGDGCRVTWQWIIHPKVAALAPVVKVFGLIWKGYARKGLHQLEVQLKH